MDLEIPIIDIQNLSFGYSPNELILTNVSLSVLPGQFFGIIGPNGGGKSTLLKLILGFLQPISGSILSRYPKEALAYVPQSLHFDRQFPITVLEVVLGGRARHLTRWGLYRKRDREIAEEALLTVGLLDHARQSFGTLSGGQAQRVLIARALASQPSLLLLDEPTASVDCQAESDLLDVIHSLVGKMTVLMVTHDLRAALTHVDGIICVQGGAALMHPREVCEHFALGLYHFPLLQTGPSHLVQSPSLQRKK